MNYIVYFLLLLTFVKNLHSKKNDFDEVRLDQDVIEWVSKSKYDNKTKAIIIKKATYYQLLIENNKKYERISLYRSKIEHSLICLTASLNKKYNAQETSHELKRIDNKVKQLTFNNLEKMKLSSESFKSDLEFEVYKDKNIHCQNIGIDILE